MNPFSETLQGLGLNEKEGALYIAFLELGEVRIAKAGARAGLKRPTAYLVVQSLEKKGFVTHTTRGAKHYFSAVHPQKLVTEAELRVREIKGLAPQLEALLYDAGEKPRFSFYEGRELLDKAYDDWFISKGEGLFIGTLEIPAEIFPRTFQKYQHMIFSKDFCLRELLADTEEGRKHAERSRSEFHDLRFIPKEHIPFEVDIGIHGKRVLITSVKKEFFTVRIESPEISHAFRVMFEMMWQSALR